MTTHVQKTGEAATKAHSPALIGMSLRQDIPGEVLSSRARFRFSYRTILKPRNPAAKKKAANVEVSPSAVSQNLTRFTRLSRSALSGIRALSASGFGFFSGAHATALWAIVSR
jgi:hypothetical protein